MDLLFPREGFAGQHLLIVAVDLCESHGGADASNDDDTIVTLQVKLLLIANYGVSTKIQSLLWYICLS